MSIKIKAGPTPTSITVDGKDYTVHFDGARFRADVSPKARRSYNREWVDGNTMTVLAANVRRYQEGKEAERQERKAARIEKAEAVETPAIWLHYQNNEAIFEPVMVRAMHASRDVYLITTTGDLARNTEADPRNLFPADWDTTRPAELHRLISEDTAFMSELAHRESEVVPDSYKDISRATIDGTYRPDTDDWEATVPGDYFKLTLTPRTFTGSHPRDLAETIEKAIVASYFPWSLDWQNRVPVIRPTLEAIETHGEAWGRPYDELFYTEEDARAWLATSQQKEARQAEFAALTAGTFDYKTEEAKAREAIIKAREAAS